MLRFEAEHLFQAFSQAAGDDKRRLRRRLLPFLAECACTMSAGQTLPSHDEALCFRLVSAFLHLDVSDQRAKSFIREWDRRAIAAATGACPGDPPSVTLARDVYSRLAPLTPADWSQPDWTPAQRRARIVEVSRRIRERFELFAPAWSVAEGKVRQTIEDTLAANHVELPSDDVRQIVSDVKRSCWWSHRVPDDVAVRAVETAASSALRSALIALVSDGVQSALPRLHDHLNPLIRSSLSTFLPAASHEVIDDLQHDVWTRLYPQLAAERAGTLKAYTRRVVWSVVRQYKAGLQPLLFAPAALIKPQPPCAVLCDTMRRATTIAYRTGEPRPAEQRLAFLYRCAIPYYKQTHHGWTLVSLRPREIATICGQWTLDEMAARYVTALEKLCPASGACARACMATIAEQLDRENGGGRRAGDVRLLDLASGSEERLAALISNWCYRIDVEVPCGSR